MQLLPFQSGVKKKKNPSFYKGTVLTDVTIKHTLFPEKILSNS